MSDQYVIHAIFVVRADSPDDAEKAIQSARLDDDLTTRWHCERTWWIGETDAVRSSAAARASKDARG